MAPVNALLDALPPALREVLLLGVVDRLARPHPDTTKAVTPGTGDRLS